MKGVGFDLDHTLAIDKKLERRALLDVLDDEELQENQTARSCGLLVEEALHYYRSGEQMLDSALTDLFARCLVPSYDPAELIARFRQRALEIAPEHVEALPGAHELFTTLTKAGIPTAILTNGWNPLQQKKARLIGYEGPVIVSDDLGLRKPDVRAFEALCQALDLCAQEILYVGDTPEVDIAGAVKAGMLAGWLNREGQSYEHGLPLPTYTLHELSEVAKLVLASVPVAKTQQASRR